MIFVLVVLVVSQVAMASLLIARAVADRRSVVVVDAPDAPPAEWLEAVMSKRITVHLVNDMTIEGSLAARMEDGIVLRAAVLLDGSTGGTAMAGETWLARDKVLMAQLDA